MKNQIKYDDILEKIKWDECCRCERSYHNGENWKYTCPQCRKEVKLRTDAQQERYLTWHIIHKYGRKSFGRLKKKEVEFLEIKKPKCNLFKDKCIVKLGCCSKCDREECVQRCKNDPSLCGRSKGGAYER